jgi:hypothetical protein
VGRELPAVAGTSFVVVQRCWGDVGRISDDCEVVRRLGHPDRRLVHVVEEVRTGVRPRIVEGCRVGVEIPALQHVLMN